MKKLLVSLLLVFMSFFSFGVGEPSTFFQVFVPPNNDWVRRDVCLIVTAIYDSTEFTIVDDDMDGDDDDSVNGILMAGQSYILYIREGGINDDAPHPGETTTKQDGDYFIISSSNLVFVSQSTNSDWQHDWVPATNKSSKGQKFIVYSPPTSFSPRDMNTFAYEDNTEITITRISFAPQTVSGLTNVDLTNGDVLVQKTINVGEDIIFNHNDGRDLLESGHTYVVEASKPITVQYGALWNNARDGGGYVPSDNGTSSGDLFYFAVPYQAAREQEVRIVSWDDDNIVSLDRYSEGAWVTVQDFTMDEMESGDWVSYSGNYNEVFRVSCTAGKKVSVFEANWLETGAPGTSDVASMVSSRMGNTSGKEFLCYMSPPGNENKVRDPFTGELFTQATHLYIFSRKNATVNIRDANTNGSVINRTYIIPANRYVDCYLTLDEWESIYNGNGSPASGPDRPYLLVESDSNISVFNTNFNDNWMAYFGTSLEQSFSVYNVDGELTAPTGDTVTVVSSIDFESAASLENVEVQVIVGDGATPISSTLIDKTTAVEYDGTPQLNAGTSQTIVSFENEPDLDPTHDYEVQTDITLNYLNNTEDAIEPNTVISIETIVTGDIDGALQQSSTSQGVIAQTDNQALLAYEEYNGSELSVASNAWSVSWADYDGDCDPDLYVTEMDEYKPNRLYSNNGDGSFTRVTTGPQVTTNRKSMASTWGDYDNDGDLDLFVANNIGDFNSLFKNNGNGTFTAIQNDPIVSDFGYTHSANWVDVNGDGNLDLFTTDYFPTRFNKLYINSGNGSFVENRSSIITSEASFSVSSAWVDYDLDGDIDVFIVNNEGENNSLYTNNGNGYFTKVTTGDVVSDGGHSVGASWGDYNGDGYPDLFVSNSSRETDFLYRNNGDGTFLKMTDLEIVMDAGNTHGSAWGDFDNDTDLDLFIVDDNGLNHFYELSNSGGLALESTSTMYTVADVASNYVQFGLGTSFTEFTAHKEITIESVDLYTAGWDVNYPNGDVTVHFELYDSNDVLLQSTSSTRYVSSVVGSTVGSFQGHFFNDIPVNLTIPAGDKYKFTVVSDQNLYHGWHVPAVNQGAGMGPGGSFEIPGYFTPTDAMVWDQTLWSEDGNVHSCMYDWKISAASTISFTSIDPIQLPLAGSGMNSFGTAWADFDMDGDLDAYVATHSGQEDALFINNSTEMNAVTFKLIAHNGEYGAIGTRVKAKLTGSDIWMTRFVQSLSGGGLAGQNDMRVSFGIGEETVIDSLVVYWASGQVQTLTDVTGIGGACQEIVEPAISQICGVAFVDENDNCSYDEGEALLFNQKVRLVELGKDVLTDREGYYSFNVPVGLYTLDWSSDNLQTIESGCDNSLIVNVTSTSSVYCDNNFSVEPLCAITDLALDLSHTETILGLETTFLFKVENIGSKLAETNTLTVDFGDDFTPLPDAGWATKEGTVYTWTLVDINPSQVVTLMVDATLSIDVSLSESVSIQATVNTFSNECSAANNVLAMSSLTVGSVDPNDIQVLPKKVFMKNQALTYKVRFQNVGNYPATDVLIVDTLPEGVDMSTLHMNESSHFYRVFVEGNVVKIYFDYIYLADSTHDEANSHGFITFSVMAKAGYSITNFENRAHIQFDRNAFITTNTVLNQLIRSESDHLNIFPNPCAQGYVTVFYRGETQEWRSFEYQIVIRDLLNNVIKQIETNDVVSGVSLHISDLQKGVYTLSLEDSGKVVSTGKLFIQ